MHADSGVDFLIRVFAETGVSLLLYGGSCLVSQLGTLECRITGIYVNLFLLSIYTLSRRRGTPGINFLIAASCVMAVVATTQMAVNIAGTVITARFVQQLVHVKVLNRPQSVRTLETVENVLLAINNVVTDLFFMYRCYVIWGCQRKVLIPPALLMLATLLASILASQTTSITNAQIPFGLAAATNLVLTALTAGRILWILRQSSHVGRDNTYRRRYNRATGIILESGAIYCIAAIFLLIAASQDNMDIFTVGFAVEQQLLIIIPTFTLVYVGLKDTVERPTGTTGQAFVSQDPPSLLATRAVRPYPPSQVLDIKPQGTEEKYSESV
ncbi:hypothetical protein B0H14DRAFT_3022275 [Mycena olivaceomarginata]|nr:hypothetical protein B0H14DRAFT_3022275 [Mycena olivaceomarginata]